MNNIYVNIPDGHDLNIELSTKQKVQWGKVLPIKIGLLPVQQLKPSLIPDPLRNWLIDISFRMGCPIDYVAATLVVLVSSLIGTRLNIKPKEKDDWNVVPNLWGCVIGDPSSLKSPSIAEVLKPVKRLTAESKKEYEQALTKYESEKLTYEVQKKLYQAEEQDRLKGKSLNKYISYPEAPRKPIEHRYMTNDATIEKIGELLNENPTGLLSFRDELIGLLAGWDRAGREQDRSFYLECWNGNGSMFVDRIGRGTIHVSKMCLSLFGGIQPSKLNGYLQASTSYANDGFVQRLQVAVYPDKPEPRYEDEFPDYAAMGVAHKIIESIVKLDFQKIGFTDDENSQSPYTRFDKEAQKVFKEWFLVWETQVLPNESGLLLEHFAKYRSLMPSLALIFHVIDYCGKINDKKVSDILVSKQAAELAVKWCNYLASHARRIYGLLDTIHLIAAKELCRHIKNGDLKDGFKARDVYRRQWSHLSARDQAQSAIEELIERNWLKELEPEPKMSGRPEASTYLINPLLFNSNV